MSATSEEPPARAVDNIDFERRFGGQRRLYGVAGAQAVFDAHVLVVGIGGVGSWAAEALARSGVGRITLIDLDHVAESNVNRQVHALQQTLGQAKVEAMRQRIHAIHPGARVHTIDDFVSPDNWPLLWQQAQTSLGPVSAVIDACDQMSAKTTMAHFCRSNKTLLITVGAAGGKRLGHLVEVDDLAQTTHDPLLAQLRYRLRKQHGVPRAGRIGVSCVFSREPVAPADVSCAVEGELAGGDGSLNCHGYGSTVAVTASFGLCAAGWVMEQLARRGAATSAAPGLLRTKSAPPSETPKNDAII